MANRSNGTRARRADELEAAYREAIETIHSLYHVAAGEPEGLRHCASGLCREALKVLGVDQAAEQVDH